MLFVVYQDCGNLDVTHLAVFLVVLQARSYTPADLFDGEKLLREFFHRAWCMRLRGLGLVSRVVLLLFFAAWFADHEVVVEVLGMRW